MTKHNEIEKSYINYIGSQIEIYINKNTRLAYNYPVFEDESFTSSNDEEFREHMDDKNWFIDEKLEKAGLYAKYFMDIVLVDKGTPDVAIKFYDPEKEPDYLQKYISLKKYSSLIYILLIDKKHLTKMYDYKESIMVDYFITEDGVMFNEEMGYEFIADIRETDKVIEFK